MKKIVDHRMKGKPYPIPRTHKGDKSAKGVGAHATNGPASKKK